LPRSVQCSRTTPGLPCRWVRGSCSARSARTVVDPAPNLSLEANGRHSPCVPEQRPVSASGVRVRCPRRVSASGVRVGCPRPVSASGVRVRCPRRVSASGVRVGCPRWVSASGVRVGCPRWMSASAVRVGCPRRLSASPVPVGCGASRVRCPGAAQRAIGSRPAYTSSFSHALRFGAGRPCAPQAGHQYVGSGCNFVLSLIAPCGFAPGRAGHSDGSILASIRSGCRSAITQVVSSASGPGMRRRQPPRRAQAVAAQSFDRSRPTGAARRSPWARTRSCAARSCSSARRARASVSPV
jgi:hypothetical protein